MIKLANDAMHYTVVIPYVSAAGDAPEERS